MRVELLCRALIEAKAKEDAAIAHRRSLEDELKAELSISDDGEGSETRDLGAYKMKVTRRINRTVDGDKLQQLAAEHGLSEHLSHLFRWRPSINMREWRAADEAITAPLASAITARPGRATINILEIEDE